MVYATVLWASRCARYDAMIAAAQAAEEDDESSPPRNRAISPGPDA